MTAIKKAQAGGKPSDMELMLYVDGELDGAREAEVGTYLEHSEEARMKVAALRMASDIVRENSEKSALDIDIASAVMAKIEAGDIGDKDEKDAGAGGAKVLELRGAKPEKSANDNARSIFALAAIAVAAAAAMMIWGRMDAEPLPSAKVNAPAAIATEQAAAEPEKSAAPAAETASAGDGNKNGENEPEHGVEVAAVDFGAHMGSVFYVPAGSAAGGTTTVVWVEDDAPGGKQ